jgi:hypothetical protein
MYTFLAGQRVAKDFMLIRIAYNLKLANYFWTSHLIVKKIFISIY